MEHQPPARRQHVTIAGNIGVGKSTLVGILAEEFGWQPYYELVADHPYLDDYYVDQERWGFHSQIWFLSQRYEQHLEIADTPISVCQDRSIYEDYEVFVKGLLEQRIFSHRDFRTYRRLFQSLTRSITPPTLLIYLNASVPTLLERINGRSRPYERTIPTEYLAQLNRRYEEWLRRFELCPVLSVETDQLDFAHDVGARREIVELISQAAGVRGMKQERMIP
ncbi:MAG: deoxynucleoside kinase [Chloroflexi bacterium SZAS-1]|nr:deoxynucleoside kinase [Chloroflexi bacterium SZAS-1]HNP87776.1 deoxynucleoside kinase [Kouleothrix sp.]